jgi:hypothetical protein
MLVERDELRVVDVDAQHLAGDAEILNQILFAEAEASGSDELRAAGSLQQRDQGSNHAVKVLPCLPKPDKQKIPLRESGNGRTACREERQQIPGPHDGNALVRKGGRCE